MNCPYKWANSTDEEDDQGSSWKVSLKEKRQKNSRVWRHLMTRENEDHQVEKANGPKTSISQPCRR